tara:strand:- start:2715 stop:3146 length:432 start_codon:yes stop_codon:yes gene_type:complete
MKKLTVKQEKFCMAFVETGEQSEAYRRSYNAKNMLPSTVNKKSYELMKVGHVAARIAELLQGLRVAHRKTMDDLLADLDEARALAISIEQPASMISATMSSAKLLGLDKPAPDDDEKGQELNINFSVSSPVDDIKVTVGKPKE